MHALLLTASPFITHPPPAPLPPTRSTTEPEWSIPERLVARRPALGSPGWEILVKWKGQGYDSCTWEPEGSAALMQPERLSLHLQLWGRQQRALARAGDAGQHAASAAEAQARLNGVQEVRAVCLFACGGGGVRLLYMLKRGDVHAAKTKDQSQLHAHVSNLSNPSYPTCTHTHTHTHTPTPRS